MLELRDAKREVVCLVAANDAEPLERLVGGDRRKGAQPLGLRAPARNGIANGAPHLVPLDTDPACQVVGESIRGLDGQ